MNTAFGFTIVLLLASIVINVTIVTLYRQQESKLRRIERDKRIEELEKELRISLPSLAAGDNLSWSGLIRALAGIWAVSQMRQRRW